MRNSVPNRVRLHHQIDQAFPLFLRVTLKHRGSGPGMRLKHIMTQMASLLAVATVFVHLWTLIINILQSEGGGGEKHTRDKTTHVGT
jgi:hypothetical protein